MCPIHWSWLTGSLSPIVKQQMQQQQCWDYSFYNSSGWPKFAYVTNPVPPETWRVNYKLHPQGCSCFQVFFYTSGTLHARHIYAHFELWGRLFCSSFLVSFFLWCCYERNSFCTALLSHLIYLVHPAHHLLFYPARDGC